MKISSIAALLLIGTTVMMAETSPEIEEMFNEPEPFIHHEEVLPHEIDGIMPEGTEGTSNTYYGLDAGNAGENNSFFGRRAGLINTGSYNTFNGYNSGRYNTTGHHNTFIGVYSGFGNTTGYNNTFNGYFSGRSNTTGNENTFIGLTSGSSNTTGSYNTFSGVLSGYGNTTGNENTFIGHQSGRANKTGYQNTFIGVYSGFGTTGNNNVFLGFQAGYSETGSNKLYIANSGTSTPLIYGEFDTRLVAIDGKLGVNTQSPTELVEVKGTDAAARFKLTSITNTGNEAAQFVQQRARSNSGDPAAVENSDVIGFFSFRGFNGAAYTGTKAGISVTATEDWSETQNGNLITISHTPNGSDTLTAALQIKGEADVYIPNGNLYVKGTKMNVPDYVFKDNYKLMPLNELKAFIKKNNHLPGVISAEEVGKAGVINLSGLQMTLLEKVEELTLYTLEQEEMLVAKDVEMRARDQKIATMEAEIEKLKVMQQKVVQLESLLTNLALDTSKNKKEKVSANLR
ncbi:MAG: hypothetical protein U9Q90_11605 [Campylobacterota bacterium]|nr:hypothetical protein [Campylobacterota bacterium]